MKRTTNILDRIGSLIPGYAGYAKRDNQRKADKALRSFISIQLKKVEDSVQELMRKTMRDNPHLPITEMEEIRKACSTIADKIGLAAYGASALFDKEQIKDDELVQIYTLDERLLDQANHMHLLVQQDQEVSFLMAALRTKLKEIENLFNERSHFIQFNGKI
jgi:predicted nucleic acid-binding protein